MKKTIKYGGLAVTAIAATAMGGGASVFAAEPELASTVYADCTLNVKATDNVTLDESDYESVAEYKAAQADEQTAIAICFAEKAMAAIDDGAFDAANVTAPTDLSDEQVEAANEALTNVNTFLAAYGPVTEENLLTKLGKGSEATNTPYALAKATLIEADAEEEVDDEAILTEIKTDANSADYYGGAAILAEAKKAEASEKVVKELNKYFENNAKAKEAGEKAETLMKEAAAAVAVNDAEKATDDLEEKVADAQGKIDELDESHTKTKLQEALDAVKDGEVSAEDEEKIEEAVTDATQDKSIANGKKTAADAAADNAKGDADAAKTAAGIDVDDYDAAKAAAKSLVDAYTASEGALATDLSDEGLIVALKSDEEDSLWQKAVQELADEGKADPTDEEVLGEILQYANYYGVKDLGDAKKAQNVVDAVDAYNEAKAEAEAAAAAAEKAASALDVANAIKGEIAEAAQKVAEAIADAEGAIEELGEDSEFAEELSDALEAADPATPTKPTDPTGPTDPTEPTETEYTYKVLNGADQVYTSGSDLSFRFDGDHMKLDKVYINNVELDSKYYTVKEGSTVIILSDEYLATLGAGEYTLKATWTDGGEGEVKFTIADAEVATPDTGAAAAGATSAVSSLVGAIMTATLAGAAVVIRKRVF